MIFLQVETMQEFFSTAKDNDSLAIPDPSKLAPGSLLAVKEEGEWSRVEFLSMKKKEKEGSAVLAVRLIDYGDEVEVAAGEAR